MAEYKPLKRSEISKGTEYIVWYRTGDQANNKPILAIYPCRHAQDVAKVVDRLPYDAIVRVVRFSTWRVNNRRFAYQPYLRYLHDHLYAGYQGWSNYETWATMLWIDNDCGLYSMFHDTDSNLAELSDYEFAGFIQDTIEQFNPLADKAGLYSDLMSSALRDVDWIEIAKACRDQ
jgi:hypothetical protein